MIRFLSLVTAIAATLFSIEVTAGITQKIDDFTLID